MKTLRTRLHRIAFLFLVLLANARAAQAATLTIDGWALGESVEIAGHGTVATAEFGSSLDAERGFSYCVDLAQSIGAGASDDWTVLVPDSDALIRAAWLVDTFHPEVESLAGAARETAIAALQVAVWEVMADAPGEYSLSDGAFALEDLGANGGAALLANRFLGALGDAPLASYSPRAVWAYHSNLQDQLFTSYTQPIPEPGTVGMYGVGLLLVAWAIRKSARAQTR